jgi:hypothetical protein
LTATKNDGFFHCGNLSNYGCGYQSILFGVPGPEGRMSDAIATKESVWFARRNQFGALDFVGL